MRFIPLRLSISSEAICGRFGARGVIQRIRTLVPLMKWCGGLGASVGQ